MPQTKRSDHAAASPAPSMEEILNSIRGVIGDAEKRSASGFSSGGEDDDVLDLTMEIPGDISSGLGAPEEDDALVLEAEIESDEELEFLSPPAVPASPVADKRNKEEKAEKIETPSAALPEADERDDDFLDALLTDNEGKTLSAQQDAPKKQAPDNIFAATGEEESALEEITVTEEELPDEGGAEPEMTAEELESLAEDTAPTPKEAPKAEEKPVASVSPPSAGAEKEDKLEKPRKIPAPSMPVGAPMRRLLEDKAAAETALALRDLVKNIPRRRHDSPGLRVDTTLEALVIETIKPYLAEWLNENLADIVKQLVSKEIKKLLPDEDE
ncbi:MAG: DUF2497 domain-containing protein [Rickettsiales bacterium]